MGPETYTRQIVKGDLAKPRVSGEYRCMLELYNTMPTIVPHPKSWGQCVDSEGECYFLCDYVNIDHRMPDPVKLAEKMAELHRQSASPTGKFGFHTTPYDGKLPLVADWDSSWTSFYTKLLKGVYKLDTEVNGCWEELDTAMEKTVDEVIPRILGALEQDGRRVKPCLIHGDLWEGNIGTDPQTNDIYIFDSCAYYAHHEMAVGMWRVEHHEMHEAKYREEYFKQFKPDEPAEECDDRNRLYALKERLMYSAHVPGCEARAQALEDLQYLIRKFAE